MPHENAANVPQATTVGAETTGNSASVTSPPDVSAAELLRAANVPEEVVSALEGLGKEQATTEQPESASETAGNEQQPKADEGQHSDVSEAEESVEVSNAAEPEMVETAEEESPTGEQDEPAEPEDGQKPHWYQKRLGKWTRQKDRMQDEIDDLKAELESKGKNGERQQNQLPRPQSGDALANIETHEELEAIVEAQREVRDWCLQNPDGMVINEGTPNEKVIPPEEVRKTLVGATRVIEGAPKKWNQIQARTQAREAQAQWSDLAKNEWPQLFDKESEVHKTSQAFLKQYPELNHNPNRDFLLGLLVEGWKPFQERMAARTAANGTNGKQANGTNGANSAAAKPKESLPEALKRKLPPIPKTIAPNPPRGTGGRNPRDEAAAAVERMAAEGGSMESAMNAIAAIDKANAVSGDTKRTPAPV